jgi:agmatinase
VSAHSATAGAPTLIGLPYDASSSHQRGAAEGPAHIRQALHSDSTNLWSEALLDLGAEGVLGDAGDVALERPERARADIEAAITRLVDQGLQPIALGGDHSVTYPIVRALARAHPGLAILHFDAHPDLYDEFQGDRYSHACPFARILEERLAQRLVQVGIRTMNGHQREQADRYGVEVIAMREWRDDQALAFSGPLYVSIDVDVLDPAFAPGVSHREPGGMSVRQLVGAIQRVTGTVIGADVVECNPRRDPLDITGLVCAKLVKEVATVMRRRGNRTEYERAGSPEAREWR